MIKKIDLKATYNKIADEWFQDHRTDTWWQKGTDKFISFLKDGDTVLDVGCGAGVKSKYLIQKGFKVVGIDFSEKMIDIAKKKVPQAKFLVMDLYEMDNLKEMYDGIFAQAVLLHFPRNKIKKVIEDLYKKLKKGGYFYVAVKKREAGGKEEEILEKETSSGIRYNNYFSYYTQEEMKKYLTDIGLKINHKSIYQSEENRWLQIIAKKV